MLNNEVVEKIEEFVFQKPRSVQEIAEYVGRSWRTTDRYIAEIEKNFGNISVRVFREGSRGALKVVYWSSTDKASKNIFQQKLEKRILQGIRKEDFSVFDIFQHVPDKDKESRVLSGKEVQAERWPQLQKSLGMAKKQLRIFSGDLSYVLLKDERTDILKVFDGLVERGVSIKVVCNIDITSKENVEKMLSLNYKHGRQLVEIRHSEQPLRGYIIDDKRFEAREVKAPTLKLKKSIFMYYVIKNKDWVDWLGKIFWKLFSSSIDANKRISEINKLRLLNRLE